MIAFPARRLSRCRLPAAVALALSVSALAPGLGRAHAETAGGRLLAAETRDTTAEAATGEAARPEASASRTAKVSSSESGSTRQMVRRIASNHGLPPELAEAVVTIESRWNPKARSGGGAIGLMQIKYATARGMGYGGSVAGLYEPKTNLTFGLAYLAGAHKLAGGDICGTILRYHAGHGAERMSASTKRYCATAKKLMAAAGWEPGQTKPRKGEIATPVVADVAAVEPGGYIRAEADAAKATPAASTTLALDPGGRVRPASLPSRETSVVAARPPVDPEGAIIRPAGRKAPAAVTETVIGSSHTVRADPGGRLLPAR